MTFFARARVSLESFFVALAFHLSRLRLLYTSGFLALTLVLFGFWYAFLYPTDTFPAGHIITIESGASLSDIAVSLQSEGLIRSPLLFEILMRLRGKGASAEAGKYVFAQPVGLLRVEERVADGAFGIVASRVTFPEGATARDMGRILKGAFPDFDEDAFLAEAIPLEGYLFPDTYFFYPDVTPHDVIVEMYANFTSQIAAIQPQIDAFGRPLKEDLIMASILEKEARTLTDKRMVARILWNRVNLGMPLQVDAVFGYINDRATYSPSLTDLATESTYNTYLHAGLPPGPIGNPGLNSLLAAVTPTKTNDLYYLTGTDGLMHYAQTFAQHKANRAKYLD